MHLQVAGLQVSLAQEQVIEEEKKAKTSALNETIGQKKATVDEAVAAGRKHEEAAAKLQVRNAVCGLLVVAKSFVSRTCCPRCLPQVRLVTALRCLQGIDS